MVISNSIQPFEIWKNLLRKKRKFDIELFWHSAPKQLNININPFHISNRYPLFYVADSYGGSVHFFAA